MCFQEGEKVNKRQMFRASGVRFMVIAAVSGFLFCAKHKEATVQVKTPSVATDRLDRAEAYYSLHPAFEKAFRFLRENATADMKPGRYEIGGDRLFGLSSKDPGKKKSEAKLEAHRKYIDIQYVIAGTETMGWKPADACMVQDAAYDSTKDIGFFKDEPQEWIRVPAGSFIIFFPKDSHAPMVGEGVIHKAVVKVAVE